MAAFIIFNIGLLIVIVFASRTSSFGSMRPPFLVFVAAAALNANLSLARPLGLTPGEVSGFVASGLLWLSVVYFAYAFARLTAVPNEGSRARVSGFVRFQRRVLIVLSMPGLCGFALSMFVDLPGGPAFWLASAVVGTFVALRWSKHLFLLRQFDADPGNLDLLFEDRFQDLVRGVRALKEVLLDRKIKTGRVLILNAEENLTIERDSSRAETAGSEAFAGSVLDQVPAGHLAGLLENYQRMERHMSLMNFALLRYEQEALSHETLTRGSMSEGETEAGGLRIHDPLLVLYHYLVEPESDFRLSDALDVIEREELRRLMSQGLVARRPGAGLVFTAEALRRATPGDRVLSGGASSPVA